MIYHLSFLPCQKRLFYKRAQNHQLAATATCRLLGFLGERLQGPTFHTFETKGVLMEETKEEFKFVIVDFFENSSEGPTLDIN